MESTFLFRNNGEHLFMVAKEAPRRFYAPKLYYITYTKLLHLLREKYGRGVEHAQWLMPEAAKKKAHDRTKWGQALVFGELWLSNTWELDRTSIELAAFRQNLWDTHLSIIYRSRDLMPAVKTEMKMCALDDL